MTEQEARRWLKADGDLRCGRRQQSCGGEKTLKAAGSTGATQREAEGEEASLAGVQRRGRTQRNVTPKEAFGEGMKGRWVTEESE
jgi:hypothetical protein